MLVSDSGPDYTSGLLTAAFRGSSTAVVPVPTLPNNIVEGEENFTAAILVPLDATLACRVTRGTPATATVVINDDYGKLSALVCFLLTRLFTHDACMRQIIAYA